MNNIYLVTGCCGFIGSNMCEFLLKNKKTVIGIDNLLTGRLENIKKFKKNKRFSFFELDVCSPIKINNKVDRIFHFASTASPKDYLKYPIKTLQIGSLGTENVLKYALKMGARVLLLQHLKFMVIPLNIRKKKLIMEM